MRRYLITHPENGIYLGHCMGLGFWSLLDSVGQTHACVFVSQEEAYDYILSWQDPDGKHYADPNDYKTIEIETAHDQYADIEEIETVLPSAMLGDMKDNVKDAAL